MQVLPDPFLNRSRKSVDWGDSHRMVKETKNNQVRDSSIIRIEVESPLVPRDEQAEDLFFLVVQTTQASDTTLTVPVGLPPFLAAVPSLLNWVCNENSRGCEKAPSNPRSMVLNESIKRHRGQAACRQEEQQRGGKAQGEHESGRFDEPENRLKYLRELHEGKCTQIGFLLKARNRPLRASGECTVWDRAR